MSRRTFTVLAILSVVGSIALMIAGFAGGFEQVGRGDHGNGNSGYFVGVLLALALAGVFTYLALTAKPADR